MGKSSLLNALAGRKIARVSGTPGKTRMLNVYELPKRGVGSRESFQTGKGELRAAGAEPPLPTPHSLYLLDLPGYGYAKAPKSERAAFRPLIEATLRRSRLAGILWLLDIRRELGREDAEVRELLAAGGVRTLAVLTKGDKLPQGARGRQAAQWRDTLEFEPAQMVVTSAQTGSGIEDLRQAIDTLLNEAAA